MATLKYFIFVPLISLMVQGFAQKITQPANAVATGQPHGKYLVMKPDQLKTLGFVINSKGLFYKNTRYGLSDKGVFCLYFTADNSSGSIKLKPGEKITGNSAPEKILQSQQLTVFNFYPVVVTNFNGTRTLDMMAAEKNPNMKLLPVQINMAGLNLGKRADTLVFWFKPTESLKKVLMPIANTDDYLQSCPAGSR